MHSLLQKFGVAALLIAALFVSSASAQHSDIDFSYANDKIAIGFGPEGQVFESEFPVITDGFDVEQETDDPGVEGDVNPNDIIDYNILGPLEYHDGTNFMSVPSGAKIVITDNPGGTLDVDDTTVGPVSGPGGIGQADGTGELHTHIEFELDPLSLGAPEYGAYGLLMSFSSFEEDITGNLIPSGIADSDPFYIVFNFGLDEATFEGAVEAFAAKVPEPTSLMLLGTAATVLGLSRRRRKPLQQ